MGKVLSVLYCVFAFSLMLEAQQYDRNWVAGFHEYAGAPGYGNVIIRFDADSAVTEEKDLRMNFESTVGVVSDAEGSLLFYTNGCYVATASGDTMPGGDNINPGALHDWACPGVGYIVPRGAMVIPGPDGDHLYYLLHMGGRYDTVRSIAYGPFYFSIVDMSANNGAGEVISKNNVLIDGDLEPFAAIRHGNGRDWWLVVPERASNRYHRFLLTPNGIEGPFVQEAGDTPDCLRIGSCTFSPDGRRFARMANCRLITFDFDRCAGLLSNPVSFSLPDWTFGGGGVAFSPDGDHLMTTTQLSVQTADLSGMNPSLDTAMQWNYLWNISLYHLQYGPDGNIYSTPLHRSDYLSVFSHPVVQGDTIAGFQPRGLQLPVKIAQSLPNFPNFRLYDKQASPCDTLGINSVAHGNTSVDGVQIFPNPASNRLDVHWTEPARKHLRFSLSTLFGQPLREIEIPPGSDSFQMFVDDLAAGLYIWSLSAHGGMVSRGKVVIAH